MTRVQSICDNIVDLLSNLSQIDEACPKGIVISADQTQVRSYKNELESYMKKYRESRLDFEPDTQQAEIDSFCEKSTALIECLLPSVDVAPEEKKVHG